MKKTYSKPTLSVIVKANPIRDCAHQGSAEAFLQRWLEEGKAVKLATGHQIETLLRMHVDADVIRPLPD